MLQRITVIIITTPFVIVALTILTMLTINQRIATKSATSQIRLSKDSYVLVVLS
jgi:succinate dehydrogenase/fumarate reductase cytochrome b subunit